MTFLSKLDDLDRHPDLLVWAWLPPLVGACVGIGIATAGRSSTDQAAAFSRTPEYTTWVCSVAAMIAVWALGALACIGPFLSVRAALRFKRRAPISAAIVLAVVVLIAQVLIPLKEPPFFFPLPYHKLRLAILTVLAEAGAFLPLAGMWSILGSLGRPSRSVDDEPTTSASTGSTGSLDPTGDWSQDDGRLLRTLLESRSNLRMFLGAAGVVIGSTTLSIGALRNAMIAAPLGYKIPVEHVLIYGFMMTLLVAEIYIPVDLTLTKRAQELVDRVRPIPLDRFPEPTWVSDRERLAAVLQLERRPLENFRSLLAVFAPFLGSLVAVLIPLAS